MKKLCMDWEALWGPTPKGEEGRRTGQNRVLESHAVPTQASADPGGRSGAGPFPWSHITADTVYSYGMKRCLLLERKAMKNLDNILKSRDITLPTKVHVVKAMVFPSVMYECESWTIKKVEHQRTDALKLWCWRRLLRVPWTARRSNQSILKEISPDCSLEGLMLKLKFQYFGHLM